MNLTALFSRSAYAHLVWGATVACMIGIASSSWIILYAIIALFCCIYTIYAYRNMPTVAPTLAKTTLLLLSLTAGALLLQRQQQQFDAFFQTTESSSFDIIATVQSLEKRDAPNGRYALLLRLQKIAPTGTTAWQPQTATVQCLANYCFAVEVDDQIMLRNVTLKAPSNKDFGSYLLKEGIVATIFTGSLKQRLLHRPRISIKRWIFTMRRYIFHRLKRKMSGATFSLFSSVFLGNKSTHKEELAAARSIFKTWGLSHFLARSGLHLVIFLMLWIFMLRMMPLSFLSKQIAATAITLLYFLFSWSSVSFYRALLSSLLYHLCNIFALPIQVLHILVLVCLMILIYNPLQLFFLDFQLSFGLTLALALMNYIATQKKQPIS